MNQKVYAIVGLLLAAIVVGGLWWKNRDVSPQAVAGQQTTPMQQSSQPQQAPQDPYANFNAPISPIVPQK